MLRICTQVLGNFPIYSVNPESKSRASTNGSNTTYSIPISAKQSKVAWGKNNSSEKSTAIPNSRVPGTFMIIWLDLWARPRSKHGSIYDIIRRQHNPTEKSDGGHGNHVPAQTDMFQEKHTKCVGTIWEHKCITEIISQFLMQSSH